MQFLDEMVKQFPIRRSREEKAAFRTWAMQVMREMGYEPRVEENGRARHQNIIAGDPEHAAVLFCAHYDTPAVFFLPNLMLPRNLPLFFLYQLANVAILLAVGFGAMFLAGGLTGSRQAGTLAFLAVYFALLMLLRMGPANRHNVNDNTSGAAALMHIMESIPPEHRGKAAFILFDNEEKGKAGSAAYAREHQQVAYTRLMVNLDCVGVGEHILIISKKLARQHLEFAPMQRHMAGQTGRQVHFYDATGSMVNSDQANFKCGVAVCACKRKKGVGFYTPAIHTARDTQADQGNLDAIAAGMSAFVQELKV